jgi:hypothetical protein
LLKAQPLEAKGAGIMNTGQRKQRFGRWQTWAIVLLAMAGWVPFVPGAAQAQSTAPAASAVVGIESPRDGAVVASSTLPPPRGFAGSASGVGDVQLILQRASGASWLSWNGSAWNTKTSVLPAVYDNAARKWEWPDEIALPHGEFLPSGAYRLQAVARARNESTLGRAVSDFTVGNTTGVAQATVVRMGAPSNDAYQSALAISGAAGRVTGTAVDATADSLPGLNNNYGRPNVWWKWRSTSLNAQLVTFDTIGSSFNTILAVDGLTSSGGGVRIGIDDNGGGGVASRLRFEAQPNRIYYISVEAYGAPGSVVLNWSTQYRPANDTYLRATSISGASGRVTGTTVDATADSLPGLNNNYGRPNVWWKWTAPIREAQLVTFDTIGSSFNTIMTVDRLTSASSAVRVGLDDNGGGGTASKLRFEAQPNHTYYIGVEAYGATGSVVLKWSTQYRPANDTYQRATAISGVSGRVTGTVVDATGDNLPGLNSNGRPNVWWKWTSSSAASQSEITFDTIGSSFNTILAVDRLISASSAVRVGLDDNGGGGVASRLRFTPLPNRTYYIGVEAYGAPGRIVLNWSQALGPANNTIRGRVLDSVGKAVAGTTVYLVPARSVEPLLFTPPGLAIAKSSVGADGSYVFTNVRAGEYLVVPAKPTFHFAPRSTLVNVPLASGRTVDFGFAGVDAVGPTVEIGSMQSRLVGDRHLATFFSGTVVDSSGIPNLPPSGTAVVAYTVYRLKSDPASMLLAPGKRGVEAIFSRQGGAFVGNNGSTPLTADNIYYAEVMSDNRWRTAFDQAILDVMGQGTYRVAVTAFDNAFNQSRNAANSTNPNEPAGRGYVLSHFAVRPAKLGITRTLPLSAPNGELIPYTITVSNSGDLPLYDVAVRQTINTDKTVLQGSSITPGASAISGADVIWNLGTLAPHTSRILHLKVKASEGFLGGNIAVGNLSVTSFSGNYRLDKDQINIESSTWVIGGAINALHSIGDAIGAGFNYVFNSSARDQRAKDDLNAVKRGSIVTRVVDLDLLQFNNGNLLIPIGANQVIAIGPKVSGGNIVSGGAGNIVSGGAGNVVNTGGVSAQSVLSAFYSNPASILAHNASGIVSGGGGNLIVLGGGNIVSGGAGNLISQDGSGLIDNSSGQFSTLAVRLIGQDGSGLIGQDGSGIINQDGSGFTRLNGLGAINTGSGAALLAGRGNVVAGGGGNVVSGGGGNIVAGGAGN